MFGKYASFRQRITPILLLAVLFVSPAAIADDTPDLVRIGIVRSLFRDVPDLMIGAAMKPFRGLMKAQTGLDSELVPPTDHDSLGELLSKNKIQFGIFEGIEFAWAKKKYPELQPLVIAVNEHQNRQAFLMIRQDSPMTKFSDLEGKELAVPRRSRSHCHLFVERICRDFGKEPKEFFSKITTSPDVAAALDDLVDDTVQATVVDREALNSYKRRKPGRCKMLREFQKSEVFPDTVVAYRGEAANKDSIRNFREGLLKADKTPIGRQLLVLWLMTEFEEIPADFEKMLAHIAKEYPPPSKPAGNKEDKKKQGITPPPRH